MRSIGLALALGLLGLGAARGADLGDPVWAKAPDRADWAKAYPTAAAQAGLSGAVKMRCTATSAGLLQNCSVIAETPAGNGFGAAALSLAAGMELKPTAADGASVAGRNLIVPVKFDPALLKSGPVVITTPDWLRLPKPDELRNYMPVGAMHTGGRVVLHCIVTDRGLMDSCKTSQETPPGNEIGSAALAMTSLFVMRPMTIDGLPVGGSEINIPVKFEGSAAGPTNDVIHVVSAAPWYETPTLDQVQAAFPKEAIGKIASGHVVLRCSLNPDGRLEFCDRLSEEPAGAGFGRAAEALVKDFKVITDPKVHHYQDYRIDVPFDFRDPSQPTPPLEIHSPLWLRRVNPDRAAALYPAAAMERYKSGTATLECAVAHSGVLTDCQVESESPADVGFGDAALKMAPDMAMNPWTSQGTPLDGLKVRVPFRMERPEPAPAVAAPAK
jgi:TonB family protein